ncbi:MAG: parallel beta-helix domain-containing protein [Myxococcota bacterium]
MRIVGVLGLAAVLSCGGGNSSSADFPNLDCDAVEASSCVRIPSGDAAMLFDTVNSLSADTAVILGLGTYELDNQVTIRESGIQLLGQGIDQTILSFGTVTTQINGVDVQGNDFLVQDLTVLDAPKDGIRVENSVGVTYRRIKATWTSGADSSNGAYGIYPVRSENVLVEDSVAENAADAGLYVGQCLNVIVRNNEVRGNVAGLEIENTQYADVYNNLAEDNTAGIVVFDLPGNPIVGRDVRIRDNMIINNNQRNFAPGGTVAIIPAGTGTFALASRRVEFVNNTYMNNRTIDIALLNGQVVEGPEAWELETSSLIGDWNDLGLLPGETPGTITNFRTENIVVAGNTHMDSGTSADTTKEMGLLVGVLYGSEDNAPSVVYDTLGETMFDAETAANNSNDNRICVGGNTGGNGFGSMNIAAQLDAPGSPHLIVRDAPFAPFDCTELNGGPVQDVTLP